MRIGVAVWAVLGALLLAQVGRAELIVTEIMFDPASTSEGSWEYVELFNSGPGSVDLSGFVLDDDDGDPISSANIAAGTISAGGGAVLYNSSTGLTEIVAGWGAGANWIPVTAWPGINNTGDRIGLWQSLAVYSARDFGSAVEEIEFATEAPWPSPDGQSSIYLTSHMADNALGESWLLSQPGEAGAYTSGPMGTNLATNVGSPGALVPEPRSMGLLAIGLTLLVARSRRRRA